MQTSHLDPGMSCPAWDIVAFAHSDLQAKRSNVSKACLARLLSVTIDASPASHTWLAWLHSRDLLCRSQ